MSIINYFKEVKAEMSHVNWPSKNKAVLYTAIVIGFSLVMAVYLGFADYIFNKGLAKILF